MARVLDLYLSGTPVAQLTAIPGDRSILTLSDEYLADENRRTISLGFKARSGGIAYTPRPRQTRIDPFLSNLLPEGKLREYVAQQDGVHPDREFELLRILGEDLPGGLIARLAAADEKPDTKIPDNEPGGGKDGPIKFSLAGVQMKLSALKDATGGLTIPASGKGGNWVVKFPSERFAFVPENEFWMMTLARRVGLPAPEIELVDVDNIAGMPSGIRTDLGRALAVKRFDRAGGKRVHMEDFAQIFRVYPSDKYRAANYEQIGEVIWREIGEVGLADYIARLVVTAAIGNGDMHLKNWSVIYPDGRTPQLAPIYDYVSTLTYVPHESLGLNLAGSKRFEDASLESFVSLADRIKAPARFVANAVKSTVDRIHSEWTEIKKEADLPKDILDSVTRQIGTLPLLRK